MSKLITLLLSMAIPAQLCATAISTTHFKGPRGEEVTLIGDMHMPYQPVEGEQQEALLEHLRSQKKPYLIVEDGAELRNISLDHFNNVINRYGDRAVFLACLVEKAVSYGIDAISVEFRSDMELQDINDLTPLDGLIARCTALKDALPALFKEDINKIENALLVIKQELAEQEPFSSEEMQNAYLAAVNIILDELAAKILDYTALSHAIKDEAADKNITICMGDAHIQQLEEHFTKLGFTRITPKVPIPGRINFKEGKGEEAFDIHEKMQSSELGYFDTQRYLQKLREKTTITENDERNIIEDISRMRTAYERAMRLFALRNFKEKLTEVSSQAPCPAA